MLPVIAIIGAPNVGKSTLFNRLTGTRDALVADEPGVTRDRQYGIAELAERRYLLVDTGGVTSAPESVQTQITEQAERAMDEADALLLLVDGRAGLSLRMRTGESSTTPLRKHLSRGQQNRRLPAGAAVADFHALGLRAPVAISAAHGHGVKSLIGDILDAIPVDEITSAEAEDDDTMRIAFVGKPNVGKSTLVNRLLGEERVVAHDMPGTTRDSIRVPLERHGQRFTLIDTAGVRRRARVDEAIERFSIIKSMQSIEAANVVALIIDAREGVTDQDATLLEQIERTGRALVIAINKWDGLTPDDKAMVRRSLELKLNFVDYAAVHYISALHGSGVGKMMDAGVAAWRAAMRKFSTPDINALLEDAIMRHPPPMVRGRRIKLRYAHQGGSNPPRIIVHGNQVNALPDAYKRYLARFFRTAFKLRGTPLWIETRTSENPYEGRKNQLTPRQIKNRKRLMRHVKRKR